MEGWVRMNRSRSGALAALALLTLALGVSGCGGGSGGSTSKEGEGGYGSSGKTTSTSQSTEAQASGPAAVSTKPNATFGPILAAAGSSLTLYMFAADHSGESACYGTCATVWPPLLTDGSPKAEGGAKGSELGTVKRRDGTTQVTYAGHPLYYYTPDKSPTDVTGQAVNSFGGPWYVLSPAGRVITKP